MIPILYNTYETAFTSNGVGRLSDCISCLVTEERNGVYEVEFTYPITGVHYADIQEGMIICVDHDETGDKQPFEIYARKAPINGVVTFFAHHISYRLSNVILKPLTASSAAATFAKFETDTLTNQPYSFWTDVSKAGTFKLGYPASVRSILGGTEGSVLDVYGGEYEFDKFTVKLHAARGADNHVTIRYGKNLTDLTQEIDTESLYSGIIPYWYDEETGDVVYGQTVMKENGILYTAEWTAGSNYITDENDERIEFSYYKPHVITMDFSDDYENMPTASQLEAAADAYLTRNTPWIPKVNIDVDFVALWQTEEYKNFAPLERVNLCDTVTIIFTALGVEATAKVIKTTWNALTEKYDSIELGEARTSFAETILEGTEQVIKDLPTKSMMQQAIDNATALITGGFGGHVVFAYDVDGKPTEIYIMDTDDANTAVNVLRMNVNGIGFSHNGLGGPFETAWTLDGSFVANFITSGILNANLIRSGVISSPDGTSYWDLDGSELRFYDSSFNSFVELDEGYIRFGHGDSEYGRITRMQMNGEDLLAMWGPSRNTYLALKDSMWLYADSKMYIKSGDSMTQTIGGNMYTKADGYIWLKADNGMARIDSSSNITLDAEGAFHLYSGETSQMNIYDNNDFQYIDLNSGGSTYVRVDGKDSYVRLEGGTNTYLVVDESNNRVRIQATDLMINGYNGDTGSFTAGGSTITVKNGIITNIS